MNEKLALTGPSGSQYVYAAAEAHQSWEYERCERSLKSEIYDKLESRCVQRGLGWLGYTFNLPYISAIIADYWMC